MRRRILAGGAATLLLLLMCGLVLQATMRHLGTTVCRKDRADILAIESACERYALDHGGEYPPDLTDLLAREPGRRPYLAGPALPLDPWRRPYRYEAPRGEDRSPRIWTFGRDGLPGGEEDDADLGNWTIRAQIEAWTDSPDAAREE